MHLKLYISIPGTHQKSEIVKICNLHKYLYLPIQNCSHMHNIAKLAYVPCKDCNFQYISDTMKCHCQNATPDANSHIFPTNFVPTAKINAIVGKYAKSAQLLCSFVGNHNANASNMSMHQSQTSKIGIP